VTGRWLFPKADLDRWLASTMQHPPGMPRAEPPPIVGGSHDPLLERALRESGSKLATLHEGSEAGFARFTAGEVVAAPIHLHALDDPHANLATMRARSDVQDAVMVGFCRREQGFLVAPGNPLQIGGIADVVGKKAKLTQRPKGAGPQLLLLSMLREAKVAPGAMPSGPMCPTGPDVAQAIRAGRADAGIATRSVANAAGLDFVPILWEPFDLVMRQRDYFRPPLEALLRFLRSDAIRTRADELSGFDVDGASLVRFVN
jgi:putative molybdopterin biosynthesis protein